ncbi:MAG: LbtU family siderophore porin [Desulfobacterales bacterium]
MAKKLLAMILGMCWLTAGLSATATAEELSNYELTQKVKELEGRQGSASAGSAWMDRLFFSGVLEAEAGYENIDYNDPAKEDEDTSDVALATMELGVDAAVNDYVSGHFLLLWEEGNTGNNGVDMDEGFITLTGGANWPAYVNVGKMYVPFGNFETHMISDPLTLELGETRESAIQAGLEMNGFYGSVYLFNGDVDEFDKDSHIDNYGANAGFVMESEKFSLDIGASYINNITDADSWEGDSDDKIDDYVGGLGAHAIMNTGPFVFIAEYITALDETELVDNRNGSALDTMEEISAWNAEFGYSFALAGKPATAAVAYQGSDDGGDFLPETRFLGSIGVEVYDATTLALEYFHDESENNDEKDVITAQLAFEF